MLNFPYVKLGEVEKLERSNQFRVECSWCKKHLSGPEVGPTTHTICPDCFDKETRVLVPHSPATEQLYQDAKVSVPAGTDLGENGGG